MLSAVFTLLVLLTPDLAAQQLLYAEIQSAPPTTSQQFVPIQGLTFTLPAQSPTQNVALVILDVPQPFSSGNDTPGAQFAITVAGVLVAHGGFTYTDKIPTSFGRMPTTIVVRVPLVSTQRVVKAEWRSVRNSKAQIDSFASLSAIIFR